MLYNSQLDLVHCRQEMYIDCLIKLKEIDLSGSELIVLAACKNHLLYTYGTKMLLWFHSALCCAVQRLQGVAYTPEGG